MQTIIYIQTHICKEKQELPLNVFHKEVLFLADLWAVEDTAKQRRSKIILKDDGFSFNIVLKLDCCSWFVLGSMRFEFLRHRVKKTAQNHRH